MTTPTEFAELLASPEGARVEFKSAERSYEFEKLVGYIVALANEGGGKIVLGVTDRRPRQVVGTRAFQEPGRTEAGILERLGRRVGVEEYLHEGCRVLIVHVPPRDAGDCWSDRGTFLKRGGDALLPMTGEELRRVYSEVATDFSAEIVAGAALADLDTGAIAEFRRRWAGRDGNARIETWSDEETLRNAELANDRGVTRAALILFGTHAALGRLLAQAETVFEYRSADLAGPSPDRVEFREGFLLYHDRIWAKINLRNDRQSYQDGFFRAEIPTFDEATIREAVLNAVCHRDYRLGGSIFVRQYARRLEVVSPGGFPPGVTVDNVLDQQNPRNRRLAEALARCGLIERAGQGVNLMIERSIRQSKPRPDFDGTGSHEVRLTLRGEVTNPAFLRFLEKVSADTLASFETRDLMILDLLQQDAVIPETLRPRLARLVQLGLVESVGRGKGTRYLLSRSMYAALGQKGTYTRRRGLDDETNKELLLLHLRNASEGSPIGELQQVVPALSRAKLKRLLEEMRSDGRVILQDPKKRRWARWFASQTSGLYGSPKEG